MNPITRVPGTEILQEYQGAKFYSNIWPLFVSYYTKEWTVGGLDPSQAVERKPENAKYFLQKDKANHKKYARSDYYLYVFPEKVAPFAEPRFRQVLDSSLPVVECGDNWCIYDMRRASGSSSAGTDP
jgi:hypothetical protein